MEDAKKHRKNRKTDWLIFGLFTPIFRNYGFRELGSKESIAVFILIAVLVSLFSVLILGWIK